jgi:PAS domain S-box-containing protein
MNFQDQSILSSQGTPNQNAPLNLSALLAGLLNEANSNEDTLSLLLEAIRRFSGWSLAELWIPDIDERDVRLTKYSCDMFDTHSFAFVNIVKNQSYPYRLFTSSPSWQTACPYWYGNLEQSGESFRRDMALQAGLRSAMSFPVFKNDYVIALVYLFDSTVKEKDGALEKELENAASLLALEIEREHLQRAYSLYFDSTNEYLAVMSAAGNLKKINQSLCNMLGEEEENILENSLLYWMHPGELAAQREQFYKITQQKASGRCETRLQNRRQQEIWVSWVLTYVAEEDYFLLSGRDITRQREMLNELHDKNTELQRTTAEIHGILANINEVLYKFDFSGVFIEAQDSIFNLTGYTPAELVGRSSFEFFHPDDADGVAEQVMNGIRQKKTVKNHLHRWLHKNGSWRWLHTSGQAVFDENNRVAYIIGVSQDITEKLEKERQLQDQEDRYRQLFLSHPVPLLVVDAETYTVTNINDAAVKHYGYTRDEFLNLHISQLRPAEDIPLLNQRLAEDRPQLQPGNFLKANWRHSKKNGEVFDAEVNYHIFDYAGRSSVLSAITDITETKKAQQALEESEQRYRMFIKNSSEAVFRYEAHTPVPVHLPADEQIKLFCQGAWLAECNEVLAKRHGFEKPEEVVGTKMKRLVPFEEKHNFETLRRFIQNNYKLSDAETKVNLPGGRFMHLSNNLVGFIENGCLVRVWGTSKDITGQKEASQRIHYLASLVENVSDSIYTCDKDFKIISWNKAAEYIYGVSTQQAVGRQIGELVPMTYPGLSRDVIAQEILQKGVWKGESVFVRPADQKEITLLISGTWLKDEQGAFQALIITGKDITERKMAEKAVIESEERFRNMADHAPVMIWVTNETDESIYYNQGWLNFTGKTLEAEVAEPWHSKVFTEDRQQAEAIYNEALRQQKTFTVEYRLRCHDGSYRWVIDRGSPRFLPNGKFMGFIGVCFDVNDRKAFEEHMMKLEMEKQKLVQKATVSGQEKEKQEISAELHDNVNQIISSAKLFMEVAKRNPAEQGDMIEKAIETLGVAIQEIRRLSKSLTPPTLGRLGLCEALQELIDDIHLTGKLQVYFNSTKDADALLSSDIKITLYRIVQEQLNNIIKYAQTDEAFIALSDENGKITLTITDNGVGFEFTDKRHGIGLTNIISRAAMFDGEVQVDSAPGKGCRLTVTIPLQPDIIPEPGHF